MYKELVPGKRCIKNLCLVKNVKIKCLVKIVKNKSMVKKPGKKDLNTQCLVKRCKELALGEKVLRDS